MEENKSQANERNKMKIEKKANNLLCIFSQYMDDYMLEEFFTDTNLTKKGRKLLKEIKEEIKPQANERNKNENI